MPPPRLLPLVAACLAGLLGGGWAAPRPAAAGPEPRPRRTVPAVHLLTAANVLPLALDPAFAIRKTNLFFLESLDVSNIRPEDEKSILFERKHLLFGAITPSDERSRYGNYFTFDWRARRPANLVFRLEYRQQRLGPHVQAQEAAYPDLAPGHYRTAFQVTGDDYLVDGRVSAWRALLVERPVDGRAPRIVALAQSFLWR